MIQLFKTKLRKVEFTEPSGKLSLGFFHKWSDYSEPRQYGAGRIDMDKHTKAIIERNDGKIFVIYPDQIKFTDR